MIDTNIQEEVRRGIEDLDQKRRDKEREFRKKRYLTKFVINLSWFFFGWIPVLFGNFLSIYLMRIFSNQEIAAQIALGLIILGWISIPLALISAIYYLVKWINA